MRRGTARGDDSLAPESRECPKPLFDVRRAKPKPGFDGPHVDPLADPHQHPGTREARERLIHCGAAAEMKQRAGTDRRTLRKRARVFYDSFGQAWHCQTGHGHQEPTQLEGSPVTPGLGQTNPGVYPLCAGGGGEPCLSTAKTVSQLPWDGVQIQGHLRCSVQTPQRGRRHLPFLQGLPRHLEPRGDIRQADEIRPHLPKLRPLGKTPQDLLYRFGNHGLRLLSDARKPQADEARRAKANGSIIAPDFVEGIENGTLVRSLRQGTHQIELERHLSHDRHPPSPHSHQPS